MFVKKRKVINFNNNELLENLNHPMFNNSEVLKNFCLQHKFNCNGSSPEVIPTIKAIEPITLNTWERN